MHRDFREMRTESVRDIEREIESQSAGYQVQVQAGVVCAT